MVDGATGTVRPVVQVGELHRIHGHVLEQVDAADIDALGRHGDGAVARVLEKGGPRGQVPHLVAVIVPSLVHGDFGCGARNGMYNCTVVADVGDRMGIDGGGGGCRGRRSKWRGYDRVVERAAR